MNAATTLPFSPPLPLLQVTVHHYGGDIFNDKSIKDLLRDARMVRGRAKPRRIPPRALPAQRMRCLCKPSRQLCCCNIHSLRRACMNLSTARELPLHTPYQSQMQKLDQLRPLVRTAKANGLPLRLTEVATLSYGGVQVGGGPSARPPA